MQLILAAACREDQTVEHALHAARNAAVVYRRGQHDAVCLNTFLDDLIHAVVILHAAQRAVVKAVVACHARMYFRARLADLELDALVLVLLFLPGASAGFSVISNALSAPCGTAA